MRVERIGIGFSEKVDFAVEKIIINVIRRLLLFREKDIWNDVFSVDTSCRSNVIAPCLIDGASGRAF